ncbi:D-alanine--D-alanine ligase [Bowdeniella nasicola]|uniref:D-alanine--D-alanine ligase n=1 Tax=Bowdeniella nasicola TaxID=208480 RepID=A0A1Q5Q0C0_9ACTO|nr:D-alanine--D-alanine ligase [Bowdeniella nasicola]OKL53323.1 D-alanine--D-alanine ligase [Bowdeniella nasicola]
MSTSVVVLAGGLSHERDVSLRSGRRIAQFLREADFSVKVIDVDANLLANLSELKPDVVWPLVHGAAGESGALQDLLQLLGLPFVGTTADGARLASRKSVAKSIIKANRIPTPDFALLPQTLFRQLGAKGILEAVESSLSLPIAVKPDDGGSALGVTLVSDAADLPAAMVNCFAYSDDALMEKVVEGTEVAISVVDTGDGPVALPPVEILTDGPYDYDARYNAGRTEYFTPARLDDDVLETACATAVSVHQVLGLRHVSRTDLIVDADGTPWVLDINVAPGMTETSLFPQAATAGPGRQIYADLVTAALA